MHLFFLNFNFTVLHNFLKFTFLYMLAVFLSFSNDDCSFFSIIICVSFFSFASIFYVLSQFSIMFNFIFNKKICICKYSIALLTVQIFLTSLSNSSFPNLLYYTQPFSAFFMYLLLFLFLIHILFDMFCS